MHNVGENRKRGNLGGNTCFDAFYAFHDKYLLLTLYAPCAVLLICNDTGEHETTALHGLATLIRMCGAELMTANSCLLAIAVFEASSRQSVLQSVPMHLLQGVYKQHQHGQSCAGLIVQILKDGLADYELPDGSLVS